MAKKTVTKRAVEVSINPYELMLILSPELRETEITKKLEEIVNIIEKAGGKITNEDFWGKKELAYRIKKHNEGVYMVYNIELPNNFLSELKEFLRIEKEVLRSMVISLPKSHVYTKYDIKESDEPRKKVEKKKVTVKSAPVVKPVVKEEKKEVEKEEEKHTPDSDPGKEEFKEKKEEKKEVSDDTAEPQGDAVETSHGASSDDTEEKEEEKPEKEPTPDMSKEEKKERKEEKEGYEDELDKKLDKILGDEDLNL